MNQIEEFIKIYNKMYIKQIKKLLKKLKDSRLGDSCRNNFSASGELIIDILILTEKEKINIVLPCLRNVYEMTLKAISLEDNKEIYNSYNKIFKKTENDGMDKIRRYIGENFNKYFSVIEREDVFEKILGEGILTYIYKILCRYAHATKVNEFVFLAQKDSDIKDILNYYLILFLIYPITLVYIDAVCTKLSLEELGNEISIVYIITTFNLLNILAKDKNKIEELKNFSKKILGQEDELFRIRVEKEKELSRYYAKESIDLLKNNNISETKFKNLLEYYFKRYFTSKQLENLKRLEKEQNI